MSESLVDMIAQNGIIAICRKIYGESLMSLAAALEKGGVKLMEVTFDQSDPDCLRHTADAIESLCERFPQMRFGAGTVLTREQVDAAKSAGAGFMISPNTDADLVRYTKHLGLVSIPGAMTPSEVVTAHNAGADFVKLFPAATLGLKYIKDLTAPINHVKLIATGGVSEENFGEYLSLGFAGAGVSGRLSQKDLIASGDFAELTRRAGEFQKIAGMN